MMKNALLSNPITGSWRSQKHYYYPRTLHKDHLNEVEVYVYDIKINAHINYQRCIHITENPHKQLHVFFPIIIYYLCYILVTQVVFIKAKWVGMKAQEYFDRGERKPLETNNNIHHHGSMNIYEYSI